MAEDQEAENNYKFTPEGGQTGKSSRDYTGRGTAVYANGEIYEGEYRDGVSSVIENQFIQRRNGKGKYTYANGDKYDGDFKENKKHGIGKLIYKEKGEFYGILFYF